MGTTGVDRRCLAVVDDVVDACVQLYHKVKKLLSSYPDLLSQFAAFLLPWQAVECNCLMDNLVYTKSDRCISALQVNYYISRECCIVKFQVCAVTHAFILSSQLINQLSFLRKFVL